MNTTETPIIPEQTPVSPAEVRRTYSGAALTILLYAVIGLVVVLLESNVLKALNITEISPAMVYILNFIPQYCIAFPIFLLIAKRLPTAPPVQHSMSVGKILLTFFIAEGLSIAGNLIGVFFTSILTGIIGIETASNFVSEGVFGEGSAAFIFFAVVCAPVIEELMFRKVLIDRVRKYGDGTAILLSGLLFGLFHGNFTQFFYAAFLGALFAFIYVRTGKIWHTMVLHCMMNFCGSLLPLLVMKDLDAEALLEQLTQALENSDQTAMAELVAQLAPLLLYTVCVYAVAITGVILLIACRKRFTVAPPEVSLPQGTRRKAILTSIGFWLLIAFCVLQFVLSIRQNIPQVE